MTASPPHQIERTDVQTGFRNFASSAFVADVFRTEA